MSGTPEDSAVPGLKPPGPPIRKRTWEEIARDLMKENARLQSVVEQLRAENDRLKT